MLVKGNRVDIFENELFEPICSEIKGACAKLDIVNDLISSALSELDKNDSKNSDNRMKEIKGNSAIEEDSNMARAVIDNQLENKNVNE